MIQLREVDGDLYLGDSILIHRYPEGDCDTICWPEPDATHLRAWLFDARETGELPSDARAVLLPDGTEFTIDGYLGWAKPDDNYLGET